MLLHDRQARDALYNFLLVERSTENVFFCEELETLLTIEDKKFFDNWHKMMARFIHIKAPEQINISDTLRYFLFLVTIQN